MLTKFAFLKTLTQSASTSLHRILFGRLSIGQFVSQAQGSIGGGGGDAILRKTLERHFPGASEIIVQDISGGCGAMYEVHVVSDEFRGMSKVKQHLSVSLALKEEIKDMHGIRIFTNVPNESNNKKLNGDGNNS